LGKFARTSLLPLNLVSDLEKAIAGRSADANAMLNQITDLFLVNVGHYTVEQLDVYDAVLKKLIAKVEVAARGLLARRLALVNKAPPNTIRSLALDNAIEVAEPILSQYSALDDDILTQCIAIRGQEHLLAIATRNKISETICYHLVTKGSTKVLGTLASNPGAAISDASFGILVKKSADDDWLSECVAGRKDIPEHHLRELLSKASEIVRQRLMTSNPELSEIIQEILPLKISTANKISPVTDYSAAERLVKSLELTETVVLEFAREKKLAEMVASIAQLSRLSAYEIERLFMGPWTSPVAVVLKALGFRLSTVDAIYHSRLSAGEVIRNDLIQTKAEFIAIRRPTAERILRFFYAKRAVTISNVSGGSSLGRRIN
jgi:Uncharacterised protein conserved in bacteria (DUF2336)